MDENFRKFLIDLNCQVQLNFDFIKRIYLYNLQQGIELM